jgi:cellulose synthase/poly-beta-1,6-N-acetylglucosamine synthase-like glycosyltransferase
VKLFRAEGNLGKSTMLNEAVKQAGGEIIAFSDATGMWSKQAIRAMAAHYADPRVACVSGWVAYRYDDSLTAQGFGVYQRFVMALRRAEAAFGAMYNTPGSIHSVRKSAFIPSPPATFLDMADPFHTAKQGLRITFEPEAISWEESRIRTQDEWVARVRICLRAWTFLFYALPRLPLLRSPMYCFQLLSHKILRWMVGPLLIPIFILNAVLFTEHWVYQLLFAAQVLYYFLTVLGLLLARLGLRVKLLSGLVFFNSVNLAYLLSALKYLRGERIARWKPTR